MKKLDLKNLSRGRFDTPSDRMHRNGPCKKCRRLRELDDDLLCEPCSSRRAI